MNPFAAAAGAAAAGDYRHDENFYYLACCAFFAWDLEEISGANDNLSFPIDVIAAALGAMGVIVVDVDDFVVRFLAR